MALSSDDKSQLTLDVAVQAITDIYPHMSVEVATRIARRVLIRVKLIGHDVFPPNHHTPTLPVTRTENFEAVYTVCYRSTDGNFYTSNPIKAYANHDDAKKAVEQMAMSDAYDKTYEYYVFRAYSKSRRLPNPVETVMQTA